jgi:hypothetical protein
MILSSLFELICIPPNRRITAFGCAFYEEAADGRREPKRIAFARPMLFRQRVCNLLD